MPNPDGSPTQQEINDAAASGNQSKQVQSPIGVPYYQIDPSTGQPYPDNRRWGADVQSGYNASEGTQGPGTASSYGHAPGSGTQLALPKYFDGSEWLPAQLPPDQLAKLQKAMVSAGLLKAGEAQLGVWDVTSMNAYKQLLAYANASGLDVATALGKWTQAHAADPNAGKAPLTVKVTNPDDLRAVFRKSVIDTLGQGWDTAKIDQMVNAYQSVETGAQQQAYGMADTGGTVTAPPDPGVYAAAQARKENPLGAQENDVIKPGGTLDAFKNMLGGWLVPG